MGWKQAARVCVSVHVCVSLPLKPLRLGRDWCIFQPQFHNQRNSCGLLMHHLNFIKTLTPWATPCHGTTGKRNVYFPLNLTLALCACLSSFSSAYVLLTGSRKIHERVTRRGKEAGSAGECQRSAAHRCKPLVITLSDLKLNSECAVIFEYWLACVQIGWKKINDAWKLLRIRNVGNKLYISNSVFPHPLCFMVYLLASAVALSKVLLR